MPAVETIIKIKVGAPIRYTTTDPIVINYVTGSGTSTNINDAYVYPSLALAEAAIVATGEDLETGRLGTRPRPHA